MTPSFLVVCDTPCRVGRFAEGQIQWRDVPASDDEGDAVKAALSELGYRKGGVCLALPSRRILSARIDCRELPRNRRRQAMLSLLEEELPLDIESMTADFLPPVAGGSLGVAVESAGIKGMIGKLEAAGVEVPAVCPSALLALWEACQGDLSCDYVLIAGDSGVDVFRMKQGLPAAWYTVANGLPEVAECVAADLLADPIEAPRATACILGKVPWAPQALGAAPGLTIAQHRDEPPLAMAARAAGHALDQRQAGWVNLRRQDLAMANPWAPVKGYVRSALALGVLAMVVLAAAMVTLGQKYQAAADEAYQQEAAAYRKLNPLRPVPAGLNRRLRSDLMRLTALSGGTGQAPTRFNALDAMERIVAALPPDVRLRVLEMRVGPGDVLIEGQTRAHADAEAVTRALLAAGAAMEPPRTENLATGGVSFTLAGKPPAVQPPEPEQEPDATTQATQPETDEAPDEMEKADPEEPTP